MTGISIAIYSELDGPEVWYETSTLGQAERHRGDEGLELLLATIPVESFRDGWRTEVLKTRDLMLDFLPEPSGETVHVKFDISTGFYFYASHADAAEVHGRFETVLEALKSMLAEEQDAFFEIEPVDDEFDLISQGAEHDATASSLEKLVEVFLKVPDDTPTHKNDAAMAVMREVEYNDRMRYKFAADITRNIEPEIARAVRLSVLEALATVDNDINALRWPSREEMEALSRKYSEEFVSRMRRAAPADAA